MADKGFKSIDRDIRKHDFDDDDFDIGFTDSTCPFEEILNQVKQPGMDYIFALNNHQRLNRLYARKWVAVDPSRLSNQPTFSLEKRDSDLRQGITTGDTLILERDSRYSQKEQERLNKTNKDVMQTAISNLNQTDVPDLESPFKEQF